MQFKTLVSHLAWEHLRRWSGAAAAGEGGGRRSLLSHLTNAHLCLKSISHEAFARNLTILAYKTFLEKVININMSKKVIGYARIVEYNFGPQSLNIQIFRRPSRW